jgi:hypothetical protein
LSFMSSVSDMNVSNFYCFHNSRKKCKVDTKPSNIINVVLLKKTNRAWLRQSFKAVQVTSDMHHVAQTDLNYQNFSYLWFLIDVLNYKCGFWVITFCCHIDECLSLLIHI